MLSILQARERDSRFLGDLPGHLAEAGNLPSILLLFLLYTLFPLIPQPTFATLAASKNEKANAIEHPPQSCAPRYGFPFGLAATNAPAKGGPLSVATEIIVNPIPNLVPAFLKSVVKLVSVAGHRLLSLIHI